jgi:type II secretory pathway component PulK
MNPCAPSTTRRLRHPSKGSVILLVLVTVLLASFMLTKFVQRAGTELLADAKSGEQARLRREAYSALEVTLAVLADFRNADQGLFGPAQGWDQPLEYAEYVPAGGIEVDVAFDDESGRLSLPRADAATLEALFAEAGADRSTAERASDALLVWMRPDYVPPTLEADPGNYERAVIPHGPAGRPLRSFDELASIAVVKDLLYDEAGRPNEAWRYFVAAVSLQAFDRVNLNAATPQALLATGMTESQIEALREHLRPVSGSAAPYFKGTTDAGRILGNAVPLDRYGAEIQALRINITVRDGGNHYRISAVVAPPGGATAPRPEQSKAPSGPPTVDKSAAPIKKLDYPFQVLEISEDLESDPFGVDPNTL